MPGFTALGADRGSLRYWRDGDLAFFTTWCPAATPIDVIGVAFDPQSAPKLLDADKGSHSGSDSDLMMAHNGCI